MTQLMNRRRLFLLSLICYVFFPAGFLHAQLLVNEFSQGASGNKEYIELLVQGTRSCNDSCADIRGWMFDDNNGWHGSPAISPGCYRFKDDPNWSCVPYGSLIVIYNNGDLNASLPAADPTDANNDGVYVLPVNSPFIELHNTLPSGSSMSYPASGFGTSTTWTNMALNNASDAVQVVDPADLTAPYHAVSYGSAVVAPVHLAGSGAQKVYYLSNDQYNVSAAWVSGNVPADETPGAPNSAANATWITMMRNGVNGGVSSNDTLEVRLCSGDSIQFDHIYRHATGYYTAIYTSQAGCDSIVTLDLTVSPVPLPPVVVSPLSYCQQALAPALTATGVDLRWYDTATGGPGNTAAPVPPTDSAGSRLFYVSQTVQGCESPRSGIQVDIIPRPAPPAVTDSTVVCQGIPSVTLQAQGQDILWYSQPVGGAGSPAAPVIPTAGALSVTWYATQTVNGCESRRAPVFVRVSTVHAAFTLSADTVCISDSLRVTNLSTGNNYINHWDFGDGFTYIGPALAHRYVQPGLYPVTLSVSNTDGCADTAVKRVWVSPVPEVLLSLDKHDLCTGDRVHRRMEYIAGFASLHWDFGDGNAGHQDERNIPSGRGAPAVLELEHAYDEPGIFFFSLGSYTPGCGMRQWSDSVQVHPVPKVDLGPDTSLCLHGAAIPLRNKAISTDDVLRYEWSTGETSQEIRAQHPGTFSLTVYTPYCSNTESVQVSKDCYIDIPNAFTPNNDGSNDYFFPRQLLSSSLTFFEMQVMNRWGQVVFATNSAGGRGWDGRFNNKEQPVGVYIYLIKAGFKNGATETYQGNVTLLR